MPTQELISVLIPTYKEADNIAEVLKRCSDTLDRLSQPYEILVIDDASPDATATIAAGLLAAKGRLIRRQAAQRSLSLSVLEGIRQARGAILVVMDGDGSHPPELIPAFLDSIGQGYDLVIASRYVPGGGTSGFPLRRKIISRCACLLGRIVTGVKDNTSGFFCIRKSALDNVTLTPQGFKIGLEIFVKARCNSFKEVPYIFVNRKKGKSKLKNKTVLEYLYQVICLLIYNISKRRAHGD